MTGAAFHHEVRWFDVEQDPEIKPTAPAVVAAVTRDTAIGSPIGLVGSSATAPT